MITSIEFRNTDEARELRLTLNHNEKYTFAAPYSISLDDALNVLKINLVQHCDLNNEQLVTAYMFINGIAYDDR